jgi:DNA helicase HerA-like ATPase
VTDGDAATPPDASAGGADGTPPAAGTGPTDPPSGDGAAAFAERITAGYASEGAAIDLGRALLAGDVVPGAAVRLPLSMGTRHGVVAGATGTGKTVTLQVIAEQLSAQGVAVFLADVKGDLTGLSVAAAPGDERIDERVAQLGVEWSPAASPVTFLSLGGQGPGVPLRASVSSFGPLLMAKVLDVNDTQRSALSLVFHWADAQQLALVDLADLRSVLLWLDGDEGKADLKGIGGISTATLGVLLRKITELDQQGAGAFFGAPELDITHLLRTASDGRGVISCLELPAVADRPRVFSTFLLWLLAELFAELPEVGDVDVPKLVFFFDEAHLLFSDAPDALVEQVTQTVRLIRSKGVGVFFVSQLATDLPDAVLAQLGNRIQHGVRAFTPKDARALRATVDTWPATDDYDLAEDLTRLGIGEAMVTLLDEDGVPTPVAWTRLRPPVSQIGAVDAGAVDAAAAADPLMATYATAVDPASAHEAITARLQAATTEEEPAAPAPPAPPPGSGPPPGGWDVQVPPAPSPTPRAPKAPKTPKAKADDGSIVTDYLRSREGRSMVNRVARELLGVLTRKRR